MSRPRKPKQPRPAPDLGSQRVDNRKGAIGTQVNAPNSTIVLSSAPATPPPRCHLPPRIVPFVGRETELSQIHALLSPEQPLALSAIDAPGSIRGLPGVGKTSLALEYAWRHRDHYERVLWVTASSSDLNPALAELALPLGLPQHERTEFTANAVRAVLEQGGPHLLILDNVEHAQAWREVLPVRGKLRVLLTTRRRLAGVKVLDLDVLPQEQALRVLRGDSPLAVGEAEAVRLCEALGCLSLALAVAGALLGKGFLTPAQLLREVEAQGAVQWSEEQADLEEELPRHPSLVRLFYSSFRLLDGSKPVDALARALFYAGGWLAPVEVDVALLGRVAGRYMKEEVGDGLRGRALGRLADLGLLKQAPGGGVLFHRLLREYARKLGGVEVREAMLDELQEVVSQTETETMALLGLGPLRPHLEEAAELMGEDDAATRAWIPQRLAQHLKHRGEYKQAHATCLRPLAWLREETWQARLLTEGGQALNRLGHYDMAIDYYVRSLEITVRVLGGLHPETAVNLTAIGQTLTHLGRFDEALEHFARALQVRILVQGESHPSTASTMNAIGQTLSLQGRYLSALGYFTRALDIKTQLLGERHPDTAVTLTEVGRVLSFLGRNDEALDPLARSLKIMADVLGEWHPLLASALTAQAHALANLGRYDEALKNCMRALDIQTRAMGQMHPDTAIAIWSIANLKAEIGLMAEAQGLLESALNILMETVGPNHPDTCAIRNELAAVSSNFGSPRED